MRIFNKIYIYSMSTGIFIGTIIFIGIGMGVSVWLKGVVSNCTKNLADLKDNLLYCSDLFLD